MSTDLVAHSGGFDVAVIEPLSSLSDRIARTDFVPAALRGKPEAVLAAMLTGEELGIKPMTSLQKIHVIEGRPGLASELMRALILQHGHEIWIEEKSTTRVTVAGCRKGSERVSRVTWTADDVKRAGLDGRPNHKKYPRAMLTARATAELARDIFPDVIGGLYALEELQDGFGFGEDDDPIGINPDTLEVEEQKPQGHVRSASKRAPEPAKTSKRKPAGSTTGPTGGRSTAEKERPPMPPIGNVQAPPTPQPEPTPDTDDEVIDAEIVEDDEVVDLTDAPLEPKDRDDKPYKGVDGVKAAPEAEPEVEPFPEPTAEEAEAERQKNAEAMAKLTGSFPGATVEDDETGEIADEMSCARLRKLIDQLDEEQKGPHALQRAWKDAGLGSIKQGAVKLTMKQVDQAERLINSQIVKQKGVHDARRKHVNALLQEIDVKSDDARHELISTATGGETNSSGSLLGRHVKQINDYVDAIKAEESGQQ